ncbi:Hypothetical predicted protein [Marmota monax]|uniref:Uncharacterized protein n=1 Tax=Marmota monax TaxID=9995 RepID=A0A5E4AYD5_MARMO|nr:hypothetical protein GHT09_017541 [Marmota monax]VTJ62195.1 Hypothetical predicted protein [Marmota monax]
MAFLVAGTLQAASQLADAQDSLGRKGEYSLQGSRVALTLSSHGVSTATVAALDCVFRSLGFENCEKRKTSVQCFFEELVWFQEQLDAHKGPVGCALVALVAPSGQLRHVQLLVRELSRCGALRGCPKVFLLLSSGCGGKCLGRDLGWGWTSWGRGWAGELPTLANRMPLCCFSTSCTGLRELCGRSPHWSLLRLLTEVEALESNGGPVVTLALLCCPELVPVKFFHIPGPHLFYKPLLPTHCIGLGHSSASHGTPRHPGCLTFHALVQAALSVWHASLSLLGYQQWPSLWSGHPNWYFQLSILTLIQAVINVTEGLGLIQVWSWGLKFSLRSWVVAG